MSLGKLWARLVARFAKPERTQLNFTPRAQQIFALARREAAERQAKRMEVIHLWLALLRVEKCSGCEVLGRLGADRVALRGDLVLLADGGKKTVPVAPLVYSNEVKKTLAIAGKAARALGYRYVGTEHILLGMLRFSERSTVEVLARHSIDSDKTRTAVGQQETGSALPPANESSVS